MARRQRKSKLNERIKKENARQESRYAEAKAPGGGDLPPGITGGVAQLTRIDFNEIENGDYKGSQRFYCHGTCIEPTIFKDKDGNEHKVRGRLVQPGSITLDDVEGDFPSSFQENVAKAENRLKLLGFPTQDFEDLEAEAIQFYKDVCEGEDAEGMFFNFRTFQPKDSDRVIVLIEGSIDDYTLPDEEDVDEGEPDTAEEPESRTSRSSRRGRKTEEPQPEEPPKDEEGELSDEELVKLGKKADEGDEPSQNEITAIAESMGLDVESDELKEKSWSDVVQVILEDSGDDSDGGNEPEEVIPQKGEVWGYKPPRTRKVIEMEVSHVVKSKETVNLKGPGGKIYKDVKWDKLVDIEEPESED